MRLLHKYGGAYKRYMETVPRWALAMYLCILALFGCASYKPMPLTPGAVQQTLSVPNTRVIRILASQIKHLILKPIPFDERNGLSPDEVAILAVINNPLLKLARDAKGIAAAQLIKAGILPDPKISFSFETPVGGDTSDKVNAFDFGLDWEISSLVARNARIAAARSHVASIDLGIAWQEWQVAEAARLHLFWLIIAQKRLVLARKARHVAEQLYTTTRKAVNTGMETGDHLLSAKVVLYKTYSKLLRIESERNSERLKLNRILGLPGDNKIRWEKDVSLPVIENIPSTQELLKDIEKRRLDLLALRYAYKSQEERVRAAVRPQFPKISIGLIGGRDTDSVRTIGAGISISFPIFDRNQGKIAIERATRKKLFDEYTVRLFEAKADVAEIVERIHSILNQLKNDDKAIQELQQLAKCYRKATRQGNLGMIDYYQVMLQLYSKELHKMALQRRLIDSALGLEIASGRYIFSRSRTVHYGED